MEQFLKNLNNSQLEATINMDGPMIVIAGAGSGKTRVLTYKIAYLMTKVSGLVTQVYKLRVQYVLVRTVSASTLHHPDGQR